MEEIRGIGIKTTYINESAHLIVTLTDGTQIDAGRVYGEKGDAATITVGKTTSVGFLESADVRNVGTENDAIFDFDIPAGKPGDQNIHIGPESPCDYAEDHPEVNYESCTDMI